MTLRALAWRGALALAAVIAALGSMSCFAFLVVLAIGHQAAIAEGQREAFRGVGEIFFGLVLAGLSSWLVWRILPPRGRVVFGALLIAAAIGSRFVARSLNDPHAGMGDFVILLAGAYAFVALIMFVLVELGHRMLVAMAETRAERDQAKRLETITPPD